MVLMMAAKTSTRANASRATRPLMVKVVEARRRRVPPRREPFDRRLAILSSDLHDDRHDHRPALGALEEEARQRVVDLGLQVAGLRRVRVGPRLAQCGSEVL